MRKDGCYVEAFGPQTNIINTSARYSFCCLILVYKVATPYNLWGNGASLDKQKGKSRTVKFRHTV